MLSSVCTQPPTVQTAAVANSANPEWGETLELPLPTGFTEGEMCVRLWDDDVKSDDDAIGSKTLTIAVASDPTVVERLTCKGRAQEGAAGYVLPDFDVSFTYAFR